MSSRSTKKKKQTSPYNSGPYESREKTSRNGRRVFELTYDQGPNHCSPIVDDSFKYYVYKNEGGEPDIVAPTVPLTTRAENAIRKNVAGVMGTQKIDGVDALFLSSCRPRIDLTEAQKRLDTYFPCKDLTIRLDYIFNYPDETPMLLVYKKESWWSDRYYDSIVLTLNRGIDTANKDRCVSSVVLKPTTDDSTLEITSMTRKEEEGKRYNKMLRSVAVFIASALPGIRQLKSVAIHPASAWSLINSYKLTQQYDYTREAINELFKNNGTMELYVPLIKENSEKALAEFHTVQCTTGGKRTRKYRSKSPK